MKLDEVLGFETITQSKKNQNQSDMFKVYVDILKSDKERIKQDHTSQFGYLLMMTVTTLTVLMMFRVNHQFILFRVILDDVS